jgi:cyclophilin family peptidyl-prolyl cis-trans isomerase
VLLPLCLTLAACGGGATKQSETSERSPSGGAAPPAAPAPGCKGVRAPRAKGEQHLPAPTQQLDRSHSYTLRLVTNCGEIDIRLAVQRARKTSSSVAYLARKGFYDGLTFHRIAHDPSGGDFVIQGGDPLGTGTGGPGYSVVEKPPADLRYTRGVVAMAKTEAEAAGTSGSQFFIVTAEDTPLPPEYALVGRVIRGDEVVSRIAAARTAPTESPLRPVVIERATLVVR